MAWLVTSVVPTGSGQGTGQANESGSGSGQAEDRLPIDPPVEIVPAPISTVMPPQIDLTICFVPSPANPTVAMAFACDLEYINSSEKKRERVKIRATNMEQFDKLLVEQLRKIRLPEAQKQPAVSIKRIPFPGENVLRRVREKVRVLMPDARVVDDN
ncbi:MAG: hypothetical protein RMJ88_16675 [Thermogemmata sp.]|nr:hypothetical protein [Thermogemmata sp.]